MNSPVLLQKQITDFYVRKNFDLLMQYFDSENQLLGFKFLSFSFDSAVSNQKIPHGLGFIPRDIIRTMKTGGSKVTFNRSAFDATNIDITTTGPVKVRLFIGTYRNDTSNDANTESEDWI